MTHNVYYKAKSLGASLTILASLVLVSGIAFWYQEFLVDFYTGARSTLVGQVFNAFILAVFFLGTLRILYLIVTLRREESAVINLYENLGSSSNSPFHNVSSESIIGKRYHIMESLHARKLNIDHHALASLLENEFLSRLSFPKFITGILVLLGMLGTIISLALALLGASDILANIENSQDLGGILNGMSTALSTTMTGIVTYILFRYYLGKLIDVQNNLYYAIERVTTLTLMPQFTVNEEAIAPKLLGLIDGLNQAVDKMAQHHNFMLETNHKLTTTLDQYSESVGGMVHGINEINQNLSRGFRL